MIGTIHSEDSGIWQPVPAASVDHFRFGCSYNQSARAPPSAVVATLSWRANAMMRLIARVVLSLIGNALGLWIADLVLDKMSVTYPAGFLVEVAIFTLIVIVVQPLIVKMTIGKSAALAGSSALIATFVALLITSLIADDLNIDGVTTWIVATIIIWLISMLGAVVLPLFLFKKTMAAVRGNASRAA